MDRGYHGALGDGLAVEDCSAGGGEVLAAADLSAEVLEVPK
jgi:hypothetical protein